VTASEARPFLRRLPPGIAVRSLDHRDVAGRSEVSGSPGDVVLEMPDHVADALAHLLDAAHQIADLLGFPGSDGLPPRLASALHAAALHQPRYRCPHQPQRLIPEVHSPGGVQPASSEAGPQQAVRLNLGTLLHANCPQELQVLLGPFPEVGVVQEQFNPDLMVAHRDDLTAIGLLGAPLLVVDILTRPLGEIIQQARKAYYAGHGVLSYWTVDAATPALTVYERGASGVYVQVAYLEGDQIWETSAPFAVTLRPADLTADHPWL
jgi:Uma2 family endonuclease